MQTDNWKWLCTLMITYVFISEHVDDCLFTYSYLFSIFLFNHDVSYLYVQNHSNQSSSHDHRPSISNENDPRRPGFHQENDAQALVGRQGSVDRVGTFRGEKVEEGVPEPSWAECPNDVCWLINAMNTVDSRYLIDWIGISTTNHEQPSCKPT